MSKCLGNMPIEVLNGKDSYWCVSCRSGKHNHPYLIITSMSGFAYVVSLTCRNKSYNGQVECLCPKGNKDIK
jgi:hypothetical protein